MGYASFLPFGFNFVVVHFFFIIIWVSVSHIPVSAVTISASVVCVFLGSVSVHCLISSVEPFSPHLVFISLLHMLLWC